MYVYKFEVALTHRLSAAVVLAETDEEAFEAVEDLLARHFVRSSDISQVSMIEKKRAVSKAGYILE